MTLKVTRSASSPIASSPVCVGGVLACFTSLADDQSAPTTKDVKLLNAGMTMGALDGQQDMVTSTGLPGHSLTPEISHVFGTSHQVAGTHRR